jgi:hypothetical protein
MHAYGSSDRAAAALLQFTGLPWSGLVRSRSLPCLPPADALPDGAFPPVGRVGHTSPPSPVRCAATTATVSLSGRCACRSRPNTVPASVVCGVPYGLVARRKLQVTPGPVVTRSPHSGSVGKETEGSPTFPSSPSDDLPRSQTPVVSCARAIPHPGLLPSGACTPSATHDSPQFGAPSRGLSPRSTRLRTAPDGEARGFAPDRLARLSSGRTCTLRCAPPGKHQPISWVFHPIPRFRASLGASKPLLGAGSGTRLACDAPPASRGTLPCRRESPPPCRTCAPPTWAAWGGTPPRGPRRVTQPPRTTSSHRGLCHERPPRRSAGQSMATGPACSQRHPRTQHGTSTRAQHLWSPVPQARSSRRTPVGLALWSRRLCRMAHPAPALARGESALCHGEASGSGRVPSRVGGKASAWRDAFPGVGGSPGLGRCFLVFPPAPWAPNAGPQLLPEAGAERRL